MGSYNILSKQKYFYSDYSLVPIRMEDRFAIMQWRNEQIYHLRQSKPLTATDQDAYFENVVSKLFEQEKPNQILFSYLEGEKCIGYGGLVHINWLDQHAELSFIIETALEEDFFELHWGNFLQMIEKVAFNELKLHKIFTYAFDLRPRLYKALEVNDFFLEARLPEHCYFEGKFIDVLIHSKINDKLYLREAKSEDVELTYAWANHPETRAYSFSKDWIDFEAHTSWFSSKLADSNCFYKILMDDDVPVGSIRLDIDGDEGTISYLIAPGQKGKGYGKKMVRLLLAFVKKEDVGLKKVLGLVQGENIASIRIFEKLGFIRIPQEEGILKFEINV